MKSSCHLSPDNFKSIEESVTNEEGHYFGLPQEALYTSEEDFRNIQSHPLVQGRWVDLGAGIGQSCFMYAMSFPNRSACGIEFSAPRIEAGKQIKKKMNLSNVDLRCDDLLHCEIPDGETYFLYFPTGPVLDRILFELSKKPSFHLVVIESHGDLLSRIKQESWLRPVAEIPLTSQRHYPYAVIFKSNGHAPAEKVMGPFQISFRQKYLVIKESGSDWLGESLGMEWLQIILFN